MPNEDNDGPRLPRQANLTPEERKSLTHGDFWIPEVEREVYRTCLETLNGAGIPYVVAGAYAVYEHAGIYRQTTDLDLFCEPDAVVPAMEALRGAGFRARLEQEHWLSKALHGDHFVDLIFGMGNGLALIDGGWYEHARPAILAANQVRVAPVEELIWHRLFIHERHRQDMADIAHLILVLGHRLNWRRLIARTAEHWPLLLSHLLLFRYLYPGYRAQVPEWVLRELLALAEVEARTPAAEGADRELTRGTMISRFSFAIDVNEWGFRDLRGESIARRREDPRVRAIVASDVWDERADHVRPRDAAAEPAAGE